MNMKEMFKFEECQIQKIQKLKRKVQDYAQRQKELLSVIVVLGHEGVDVEKIYSDVISGRISVSEDEA